MTMSEIYKLSNDGKTLLEVLGKNITHAVIPDGIAVIGRIAFRNCKSLESINIPNSVKEIGSYAFSACESLKGINIPTNVSKIGRNILEDCPSLEYIKVASDNKHYTSIDGVLFNKNIDTIIKVPSSKNIAEYSYRDITWALEHTYSAEKLFLVVNNANEVLYKDLDKLK